MQNTCHGNFFSPRNDAVYSHEATVICFNVPYKKKIICFCRYIPANVCVILSCDPSYFISFEKKNYSLSSECIWITSKQNNSDEDEDTEKWKRRE